jgi:hypothetical protein
MTTCDHCFRPATTEIEMQLEAWFLCDIHAKYKNHQIKLEENGNVFAEKSAHYAYFYDYDGESLFF